MIDKGPFRDPVDRRFRLAGVLMLAFPVFAGLVLAGVSIDGNLIMPIVWYPFVVSPALGLAFAAAFTGAGTGILARRRWAVKLATIVLAIVTLAQSVVMLSELTAFGLFSFFRLPYLGWLLVVLVALLAFALLTVRRSLVRATAIGLLSTVFIAWVAALVIVATGSVGDSRGGPRRPSMRKAPDGRFTSPEVRKVVWVLSSSVSLAYPIVVLILIARWRLDAHAEAIARGKVNEKADRLLDK